MMLCAHGCNGDEDEQTTTGKEGGVTQLLPNLIMCSCGRVNIRECLQYIHKHLITFHQVLDRSINSLKNLPLKPLHAYIKLILREKQVVCRGKC